MQVGDADAALRRVREVRSRLPEGGLFSGQDWQMSPLPLRLSAEFGAGLEKLGRVLLQFQRASNLLYRWSVDGRQPEWAAGWLDKGKPSSMVELQRHPALRAELPRVIRPDLLLTEDGVAMTELDSVPGGMGLTAWLNGVYAGLGDRVMGGADGMQIGFSGIFGSASKVHVVVSEEAAAYAPEMRWLAGRIDPDRFRVQDGSFSDVADGEAAYRFFELFDVANVPGAGSLFEAAVEKRIQLSAPPKAFLEEKLWLALLWNGNLREFWRRELGDGFLRRLLAMVPRSWVLDPAPLPPHGGIPGLDITTWDQLKVLSQRDRDLVLKISGYSERAWGARGVHLGSDLPSDQWSLAVEEALRGFDRSPHILQRYHKPRRIRHPWFNPATGTVEDAEWRVRLCPYYFVHGSGDAARANLGGVLATLCPADKKIIHGMRDAVLVPCVTGDAIS